MNTIDNRLKIVSILVKIGLPLHPVHASTAAHNWKVSKVHCSLYNTPGWRAPVCMTLYQMRIKQLFHETLGSMNWMKMLRNWFRCVLIKNPFSHRSRIIILRTHQKTSITSRNIGWMQIHMTKALMSSFLMKTSPVERSRVTTLQDRMPRLQSTWSIKLQH